MEPIVNVTIKLKDIEFSLTTDEAKELHSILSNLLGLKSVGNDDLQKLAELIKGRDKSRPIHPIPIPYPIPYPIYPRPYRWWEIEWTMDTPKVTSKSGTEILTQEASK